MSENENKVKPRLGRTEKVTVSLTPEELSEAMVSAGKLGLRLPIYIRITLGFEQ